MGTTRIRFGLTVAFVVAAIAWAAPSFGTGLAAVRPLVSGSPAGAAQEPACGTGQYRHCQVEDGREACACAPAPASASAAKAPEVPGLPRELSLSAATPSLAFESDVALTCDAGWRAVCVIRDGEQACACHPAPVQAPGMNTGAAAVPAAPRPRLSVPRLPTRPHAPAEAQPGL